MNVAPINLENTNTSFNGRIIIKGHLNASCRSIIENSDILHQLTNGKDIIIRTNAKRALFDKKHPTGMRLYKLAFSLRNENSFLDKIKDFFGLIPREELSLTYHSKRGTKEALLDNHFASLIRRLKQQL